MFPADAGLPLVLFSMRKSEWPVSARGRVRPEVRRLNTHDGFFEPAGRTILKFENASDSEPAEIVCFYLGRRGGTTGDRDA